ncbi:alpha/beta fold hydrolase [Rhodococcus sp. BP-252]|uniref:alpha/beta fold hydrolase n=1 Tax=unclassified Rhodococcus (in: high G+C Gram-positive bacteria) TaxID=192944 RepID=UPI001C9A69A3|nr:MULTISPECIES: alpha/beta fold hydrolase [unclassified Rhodococcus (in: high G+C Gram-positive bacteria)]MBY6411252.1 alpha/beta fold hydrolase [Rhodococcus sp. BP-320]MBY6415911.1 alpha/beta fold hydrolase [Rhodococcus sp. BP-321]MBY6420580.1 alpha/beta fold hydrolase [Rhodococcus sp. BP-324]MBY6426118.1 alpha/beta fold hydrolase [Rhodococcus sp. BP-323]MBY6431341.1 alpha/beta fold hydrolase [Rhodococcus sp. BP-322]
MQIPRPRRSSRAVLLAALTIAAVVGIAVIFVVRPFDSAPDIATLDTTVTVPESPGSPESVDLDTRLYVPESTPAPAVLLAHGFGGDKFSVDGQARALAEDGFTVLTYSARGFGTSTGTISLNDPDREVADGRALIDWLADRPEVQLDGPGDPRVGVAGGSYGGALALSVGGTDPRVDAVASAITWNDLGQALFPNYGVTSDAGRDALGAITTPAGSVYGGPGVLKRGWAGVFFGAGSASGASDDSSATPPEAAGGAPGCGRFAPEFCAAYGESAVTGVPSPELLALLTAHSPAAVASNITAPTLLVQGVQDTLFGLDQADATARQIADAGGDVEVRWFGGGHDAGGTNGSAENAMKDFLDAHLRGETDSAVAPFAYTLEGSAAGQQRSRDRRMTAADYPGLASDQPSSTEEVPVPLSPSGSADTTTGEQTIIRPPGASPSAISSVPGLGSILSTLTATTAGAQLAADIPGQSATFTSEPLTAPLSVTGASRVNLRVGAFAGPQEAVLFVKFYDVGPDGRRTLPGGAVAPIRLPDTVNDGPIPVTVTLPGISYVVPEGHRVEVSVSTTDQAYAVPLQPAQFVVALDDPVLTVPMVDGVARGNSSVPIAPLVGIGAIAVAVATLVAVNVIRSRRRLVAEVDESLVDTPLVITDLAKTYSNSFKAVDGVSFAIQQGQVLGLLGPNGAGKTTTLRMLMGLITPTSGEIRVFGHKVSPGAPVLSRLGSFVEGSGFLPHLSGIENLRLYWQATGRPLEEAHLDEALEIADLGAAVERKVKSYSQGMRQRLAIAQAMLGLPDLMVLDEPTNGLDPPQIRAMRDVLIDYARTGRTVLVSSHLLAEVEQTCTHVVVMNRGSVISTGTVKELTASGGLTDIRVSDPERGAEVVRETGHTPEVTDDGTLRVDLGTTDPGVVVRALVDAGLDVRGVSQSTRLEDVFLELVHGDSPANATAAVADSEPVASTKGDR